MLVIGEIAFNFLSKSNEIIEILRLIVKSDHRTHYINRQSL